MSEGTKNRRFLGPRPGDYPLGSVESRAAARAVQLAQDLEIQEQLAAQLQNLTPLEQAFCDGADSPGAKTLAVRIVREVLIPKHKMFGFPLPDPKKIRKTMERLKKQERAERVAYEKFVATRDLRQTRRASDEANKK